MNNLIHIALNETLTGRVTKELPLNYEFVHMDPSKMLTVQYF